MDSEKFDALVARLEGQAQAHPGRYRLRVLLLALAGNLYVAGVLALVVALLAALVVSIVFLKALAIKLILVVGFFLWMILKALWVRVEPPAGTEVRRAQAPELFALVDELRRRLGAPRFHHLLVTADFNAGVVQSPRLGVFGWHRNYLLLGLPLMKALTVDQFKAVVAHELGHLARGHGRMSNWIYRQRLRWSRLIAVLNGAGGKGGFLLRPFVGWFVPYFNAYSFPMARANEYEADATSARLTSPRTAAEALTGVNVLGSYLQERYWPGIHQQADEHPQPAFAPYLGISHGVATEVDEAAAKGWLDRAMAGKTDSTDTHPALGDRLAALGEVPRLALAGEGETADRLLGAALEEITGSFDRQWRQGIQPSWEERHRAVQDGRRRLAELNAALAAGSALAPQEAFERARLTESVGKDPEDAFAQFRELHARHADDALVCLAFGARLLNRDDAAGCALVESAMRLDESATASACELLRDYHWRQGAREEAHAWHRRLVERLQLQEAAAQERNQLLTSDRFDRHGLSDEALAGLLAGLKQVRGLRKAYFVRKRVRHLAHSPCYVLGYKSTAWYQLHNRKRSQEVLRQIRELVRFPGETLIIPVDGDNYRFGRKFAWMRGSRIV